MSDELILISMPWWINRIVVTGHLKIRKKCTKDHCIAQKLTSLFLTFWKTIMEMLLLWTRNVIWRWRTTPLCLNYDENVFLSDVCSFSRTGQQPIARPSMDVLCPFFGDHLMFRFTYTPWSPDLSMDDDFLCRNLKARLYEHKPRTLNDLKEGLRVEVAQIKRKMLERVKANF